MDILTAIEKLLTEDIYTDDRLIPKSVNRVALNTNMKSNEKILNGIYKNIVYYKTKDRTEISKRIDELQSEWDTERILEANAAAVILASLILGIELFGIAGIPFYLVSVIIAFLISGKQSLYSSQEYLIFNKK